MVLTNMCGSVFSAGDIVIRSMMGGYLVYLNGDKEKRT